MIGSRLWQVMGWTMLNYLWIGAALGVVALLLRRGLRSAAANVRYLSALGSLLLLSASPLAIAVWEVQSPAPRSEVTPVTAAETATPLPAASVNSSSPIAAVANNELLLAALNLAATCLPWLWICGAPLTFLLTTAGLLGAERLRRQSRPLENAPIIEMCRQLAASLQISYRVGVAVCDRIAAPILVGILRPMILLPAVALTGWEPRQLEMVLLHELAHVRRYDNLVNLLQRMIESLLFFHPMVWIVSGWVRREREYCCDELVVARTRQPQAYAEVLVTLAEKLSENVPRSSWLAHPQAVSSLTERPLVARVRRILKKEEQSMQVSRKAVGLVLVTLLALAVIGPPLSLADWASVIGNLFSTNQDADKAVAEYTEAVRLNPNDAVGYFNRGTAYRKREELRKAIDDFTEAIRRDPKYAQAYNSRGMVYSEQDKPDLAIADYSEAIRLDPKCHSAHNNLGVALWQGGRKDEAAEHWQKALELRPGYADAHSNLGFALKEKGKLDEATSHFKAAILCDPGLAKAYNNLGLVLLARGKQEEAEEQFLEAIRRRPDELVAHENLARLYWQQGLQAEKKNDSAEKNSKYGKAVEHLQVMLKLKPGNPVAVNSLVLLRVNQGKFDEAIAVCRQAVAIDPKNLDARHNLGVVLLKQGKIREAIDEWKKVLELKPDAMPTKAQLAWILSTCQDDTMRNGKEAVKLSESAVEISGRKDPTALDTLAAAYAEVGEFDKATKAAEEAAAAASKQNNKTLEDTIRARNETYRSGSAFRDPSLAPPEKSKSR